MILAAPTEIDGIISTIKMLPPVNGGHLYPTELPKPFKISKSFVEFKKEALYLTGYKKNCFGNNQGEMLTIFYLVVSRLNTSKLFLKSAEDLQNRQNDYWILAELTGYHPKGSSFVVRFV